MELMHNDHPDALSLYVVTLQVGRQQLRVSVWAISQKDCMKIIEDRFRKRPLSIWPFLDFCEP